MAENIPRLLSGDSLLCLLLLRLLLGLLALLGLSPRSVLQRGGVDFLGRDVHVPHHRPANEARLDRALRPAPQLTGSDPAPGL